MDDVARLYKGKTLELKGRAFYDDICSQHAELTDWIQIMIRHKTNLFRCIRDGGLPISDAFSHVQTMNTCHLCAIAARLGRTIHWDPQAETIVGDDQAAAFVMRRSC